jgi:CheY-like chemotaxis protein
VLSVRDTGAGIAPEIMPSLFEPFMQAVRTLDRSVGGLGLGLALVKGLVELQGGTVSADSRGPNQGSTFVVRLPLERRKVPRSGPAAGARGPASPCRVLVIEDNPDAAESLKAVLELDGHAVEAAYGGPDGLEKARAFRPDVVLCDLGLPGMDRYHVAAALRGLEGLRGVPLIAISGYGQAEDVERSRAAGFDLHLTKPVAPQALGTAIAGVRERAAGGGAREP